MRTNYVIHMASKEDLDSIQQLVTACDVDDFSTGEFAINIKDSWGSVPLENTCVIFNNNQLAGYAFVEEIGRGRLDTYGFVHPELKGNGIGNLLIGFLEERSRAYIVGYKEEGIQYELNNIMPFTNSSAKDLLISRGYYFKRVHSLMTINFEDEPEMVTIPQDIELKECDSEEKEREIYEAYCDAFRDSNSFYPKPFEEWIADKKRSGFDKSLWLIGYFKGEPAGFIIGEQQDNKIWVNLLGTKRAYRKMGIGTCLLKTIFLKAFQEGFRNVSLTVDESSITNANMLYLNLGMKPVFQIGMYGKNI